MKVVARLESPFAMTSLRLMVGALLATPKDRLKDVADSAPTARLEMPSFGLIVTCAGVMRERSKQPVDVTFSVAVLEIKTRSGLTASVGVCCTAANGKTVEAEMFWSRIVSVRGTGRVQLAMLKDTTALLRVALAMPIPEMPSSGVIVTCETVARDRSIPPDDLMVRAAAVPTMIGGGSMAIAGGPCETPFGTRLRNVPWVTDAIARNPACGRPLIWIFHVSVLRAGISWRWMIDSE